MIAQTKVPPPAATRSNPSRDQSQDDTARGKRVDLSIVIPFHNEQDSASQVIEECRSALDAMIGKRGEMIAIDDGSSDGTAKILESAARSDARVTVLTFRRNRGQASALFHGLRCAQGEILVTLDGDGQNNPADIPALVATLEKDNADLVSGIRVNRHDSWLRKFMSRLANRVRSAVLGDGVTDSGCALKAFRRPVIDALIPIQTLYSFIPALAKAAGSRITECPVDHRNRIGGKTHYGLSVFLWRPALDMLGVWWFSRRRFPDLRGIVDTKGGQPAHLAESAGKPRKQNRDPGVTILCAGIAVVFLTQLGSYGLLEPDEGRYAEIGREMAEPGGDWLIPKLNGISHFQKPPVIYWLTAASLNLFGPGEFGARLPSAISAIATLFLVIGITQRLFGDRIVTRHALVILASSPLFLFLGRTLTPDMHMTFWITAAIYCLVRSKPEGLSGSPNHRPQTWGWLFFVCLGFGFLTKGPVAFLVPISAAIGYSISLRRAGIPSPRLPWFGGLPMAILIGLSWFLIVSFKNPGLAEYFLKHELLDRFASGAHGRSRPFWFFVPVLLAGFLPWTLIALRHLPAIFRNPSPEFGLFLGWIGVPFLVLSLSGSKLPTYILPLFPGLAIALGAGIVFASCRRRQFSWPLRLAIAAFLTVVALFPPVVAHFFVEPSTGIPAGSLWFSVAGLAGIAFWLIRSSRSVENAIVPLGVVTLFCWIALPSQVGSWNDLLEQQASVKPLAERILSESAVPDPPRVIACEIRAHSLEFYLGRTVEITRNEADIVLPENSSPAGQPVIHRRPKDVAALLSDDSGNPVFVVTRSRRYHSDFAERGWTPVQTAGDFILLRR